MTAQKTIKQAIRRKFPTIDLNDTLEAAITRMKEENASILVAKMDKELIGLVTVSDIMFSLTNGANIQDTKVSSFMTKCEFDTTKETRNPCLQLDEDEDAMSAIKVMYESGLNHLLVSGANGKAVGIVSSLDIVKLYGQNPS